MDDCDGLPRQIEERFLHCASQQLHRSEAEEKASARFGRNDTSGRTVGVSDKPRWKPIAKIIPRKIQQSGAGSQRSDATDLLGDEDLVGAGEDDVDGGGDLGDLVGGGEGAGGAVDAEDDDVVGLLIGGEEEIAGGIEGKISWGFALRGEVAGGSEGSFGGVDGEDGDAVAAAIGSVEKFAGRVDDDFGGVILSGEVFGKRGEGLER